MNIGFYEIVHTVVFKICRSCRQKFPPLVYQPNQKSLNNFLSLGHSIADGVNRLRVCFFLSLLYSASAINKDDAIKCQRFEASTTVSQYKKVGSVDDRLEQSFSKMGLLGE
jgi:hypothetical protein